MSYSYLEYSGRNWIERFPGNCIGGEAWSANDPFQHPDQPRLEDWLPPLRARDTLGTLECPRLFISHRQIDTPLGQRIARIAQEEEFEFWLDVLDPQLAALNSHLGRTAAPAQRSLAIAGIIEMALLNSTHVIALVTSRG